MKRETKEQRSTTRRYVAGRGDKAITRRDTQRNGRPTEERESQRRDRNAQKREKILFVQRKEPERRASGLRLNA